MAETFEIRLTRDQFLADRTLSVVEVDMPRDGLGHLRFGYALEDVDRHVEDDPRRKVKGRTAIPTGRYKIRAYDSPKHGPNTLELVGVPGFQHVQIHSGNTPEDTEGCLLIGLRRTASEVSKSKVACDWLKGEVLRHIQEGGEAFVEVRRA